MARWHHAMQPMAQPLPAKPDRGTQPHTANFFTLPTIVLGLLGGGVMAALIIAWRLGLTAGEAVLAGSQMVLFLLNSWLLSHGVSHAGAVASTINLFGLAFMAVRCTRFTRAAILLPEAPEEYAPIFADTSFGYAIYAFYLAECMLTQVVLHRLLPAWACIPAAALQAHLFSQCNFRFISPQQLSAWRMARVIATHQVGMFVPYHVLSHPRLRSSIKSKGTQPAAATLGKANGQQSTIAGSSLKQHAASASPQQAADRSANSVMEPSMQGGMPGLCLPEAAAAGQQGSLSTAPELCSRSGHTEGAGVSGSAASKLLAGGLSSMAAKTSSAVKAGRSKGQHVEGVVRVLAQTPYHSRLRVVHRVCVKLDTDCPCSSLPPSMADGLQEALRTGIGRATSLTITDMAVRSGCIAITLRVEELLPSAAAADGHGCTSTNVNPSLQTGAVARALLPQLQSILADTTNNGTGFTRAMVQLDDCRLLCMWQEEGQSWDTRAYPTHVIDHDDGNDASHAAQLEPTTRPWLGIARAVGMQRVVPLRDQPWASSNAAHGEGQVYEVLTQVQLWGVSKVTEVEGWSPPTTHLLEPASDLDWDTVPPRDSSNARALRVLARSGGSYLTTQVVRLVPGPTDDCVTAQVCIQLHEQQLVRHHTGGCPSTLLLIGLELWQNELLLSSTSLLSRGTAAPSSGPLTSSTMAATANSASPTAADGSRGVAMAPWWWGATDKAMADAVGEAERCTQLLASAAEPESACAVHSYVQFGQDLAAWLAQVQRVAHSSQHCLCSVPVPNEAITAAVGLHQPSLEPAELCKLGQELKQYALALGWPKLHDMISQQLCSVVQPAAATSNGGVGAAGSTSWLMATLHATRTALLGYRCQHDERQYKQQLSSHLRGVIKVSSAVASLIGVMVGSRAAGSLAMATHLWTLLHVLSLASLLSSGTGSTQAGLHNAGLRRAFFFTMLATMWRITAHWIWAVLVKPAPDNMYTQARSQPFFAIAVGLAMAVMEQVPASVVLPTLASTAALLAEALAVLLDSVRLVGWQPMTSCLGALALVVGAHVVLDVHLRKQLAPPTSASVNTRSRQRADVQPSKSEPCLEHSQR